MTLSTSLDIVLTIVLIVLAGISVYAVSEAISTLRAVRRLTDGLDERLLSLIESASKTLETVDREMLRVDSIVSQFEEVSDTVSATTRVASEAVRRPLIRLAGIGGGVRGFLSALRRG